MPLPSLAVGHETTLSVERRSQRRRVGVSLLEPLQQRRRLARHRPDHLWPTRARMGVARQTRQQARHCGRLSAAVREALRGASLVRARQAAGQPPVRQLEGELHHAYSRQERSGKGAGKVEEESCTTPTLATSRPLSAGSARQLGRAATTQPSSETPRPLAQPAETERTVAVSRSRAAA